MSNAKKQTVYILIGLPGIGKSTWVRKQLQDDKKLICVSKDAMRTMAWCGDYKYIDQHEPLIKEWNKTCISAALLLGYDVIVDECHVTKSTRMSAVNEIYRFFDYRVDEIDIVYVQFIINLKVDVPMCVKRRLAETKGVYDAENVWPRVINGMAEAYEEVQPDELTQIKSHIFSWNCEFLS